MKLYLYDKNTLEYIQTIDAEADPEETKLQGQFVPLIPANATTIAPPEFEENEVPIFAGNTWIVYPDFRKKFFTVDENLSVNEITTIGIPEDAIIVSKEIAEEIMKNPQIFRVSSKNVIKKSQEEIDAEIIQERKSKFEKEFFETSLGWIRRKVSMKDGEIKDFLSDLVLAVKAGIELGEEVSIITYKKPDFTCECTAEYLQSLQERHNADLNFVKECLLQTVRDFE